eukprot:CCRYP_004885-RA/>CCRYP_004885-RA protein AED:0.89 eAED:0.66 QI:0/-1/0/1/-1/1/1/0/568
MNEITNNNKTPREGGTNNNHILSDVPVEILSVPTKIQDGNGDLQYAGHDVAATSSFVDPFRYGNFYSGVDISPMPPTPTPATAYSGMSLHTPSSQQYKDTLKTLYHSSRRSRHDSPSPMPVSTDTTTSTLSTRHGFPPPPPLAAASPKTAKQSAVHKNACSPQGNVSYHSAGNSSSSSLLFHDSRGTSMGFLADFIAAPPLYHSSDEERKGQAAILRSAAAAGAQQETSANASFWTPLVPAKPTLSTSQFEYTPNTTMDRQLLDLANESSANMCMEQFAKFSTRACYEFEEQEDGINIGDDPGKRGYEMSFSPRKKQKGGDGSSDMVEIEHVLPGNNSVMYSSALPDATRSSFEQTPNARRTKISSGIIAHPTNENGPLNDGIQESIQCLLALSNARPLHQIQDKGNDVEHETHHNCGQPEGQASRKKDLDIIQRKVRRLLLIRHATRCKVPVPPSASDADDSSVYVCPVSSHCAEGKRLASHIRKCKDVSCEYKWCLTTRDVLGHYRSCRDRKCQICGPVRAMHVHDKKHEEQKEDQETCSNSYQRSKSENSMETIEDKEWLHANMS